MSEEKQQLHVDKVTFANKQIIGLRGGEYAVISWDQWQSFIKVLENFKICDIQEYKPVAGSEDDD